MPFVWAPIPFPDTNRIDMALTDKRRNWTPEEDVVLLTQVAADLPFAADKGQVTKSWQSLADKLVACDHFDRVVDGRKVQNMFTALVDEHRKFDMASAKLSGVDQEELEKHTLLDELLPLLDEVKSTAASKRVKMEDEKDKIEQGVMLRELASREKQLEFDRFKYESDLKQRELDRDDRKAEREHQLALARIESEKVSNLLKSVIDGRK
ncbi:hypothetical protein DYB30_007838 [Aphanomyces astaci]|uniref:Myb-like domain-containing protein n=1 Tax=Aphanomyces astaci TaxID=112090 RepID=A0A397DBY4_APHAT|nr:hypothetical protein DYB30_007838 [Aphanomyces astaci]RHY70073.1 hypothetical protein DYB34_008713 [Aphanomyces astaci]RHZ06143.1 hypothetical protein DYB26_002568 [Aphanomyces astaci]RHZ07381.1 hypothetical protein DYB31_003877 [Aphanomyces astaci]